MRTEHETESEKVVVDCAAGAIGNGGIHHAGRLYRPEPVELARARPVRLAYDHLLAGPRGTGALPHSVRRLRIPRSWPVRNAASHGRALGKHDARGARALSSGHARALRHGRQWQRGVRAARHLTGVEPSLI